MSLEELSLHVGSSWWHLERFCPLKGAERPEGGQVAKVGLLPSEESGAAFLQSLAQVVGVVVQGKAHVILKGGVLGTGSRTKRGLPPSATCLEMVPLLKSLGDEPHCHCANIDNLEEKKRKR